MSRVLLELPVTFEVQKYLLDWAKETKTSLSLIDIKTGLEIYERFVNTGEIGLTMEETPANGRKLGFVTPATLANEEERPDPKDENRPAFEHEALLFLPDGDTWILEVVDAKDIDVYAGVAGSLSRKFNVTVQMSAVYMDNPNVTK